MKFFKLVFHATSAGDMEAGVQFPPFEINLDIWVLNSSINSRPFLKPIITSDPYAFAFFLVTLINISFFYGYIRASEKIFGQIVSPLKLILSPMAMFHVLFQQF